MATVTVTPAVPAIEATSSVVLNEGIAKPKSQGGLHEVNTRSEVLSVLRDATDSISGHREGRVRRSDSGANTDAETERKLSAVTAARQLSALGTLLKRRMISEEKHAAEVTMLKAKLE